MLGYQKAVWKLFIVEVSVQVFVSPVQTLPETTSTSSNEVDASTRTAIFGSVGTV